MDLGNLTQFLPTYLMIVVAAILVLGYAFKKSNSVTDK